MSFTDEDLKRLKVSMERSGHTYTFLEVKLSALDALLARLQAAEIVCKAYAMRPTSHLEHWIADMDDHYEAWRKSAGKGGA